MENSRQYDLEGRTLHYAQSVSALIGRLHQTLQNVEYSKQLVRSSGSVGANYIEANEALSKKDFVMRIKICRKEAKESRYWLNLISAGPELEDAKGHLIQESTELMKIFGAILEKAK